MTSMMYAPIGWARRPNGSYGVYKDTLRHLRDPNHTITGARTLCGVKIPKRALMPPPGSGMFIATVIALADAELAALTGCVRCYKAAGLPMVTVAGRMKLAEWHGNGQALADKLFELERLR